MLDRAVCGWRWRCVWLAVVLALAGRGVAAEVVAPGGLEGAAAVGDVVWIEAERFEDCGGWLRDSQFVDLMGSPYLLAVGLGKAVRDAVTTISVPRGGSYRVWLRTKDWLPEFHPGRFQLFVGGTPLATVFGLSGTNGWQWQDGGTVTLPAGGVELRLHDLTGDYGRCDAMVLAADSRWRPPGDAAALVAARVRYGGVSAAIEPAGEWDVVVIGGGVAGCTAAVAAARHGARTALIQDRPVLGGNASTEIFVPPVGVWPHGRQKPGPLDPRETGIIEDYRTDGNQTDAEMVLYSDRLMRFVRNEPTLELFLNTHATGAVMRGTNAIAAVDALDTVTGTRRRFAGRLFIDCTGDSVVALSAGADYRQGKEPRAMYGEPWAPEEANSNTMGNSLKYVSRKTAGPVVFTAPPWAYRFDRCDQFRRGRHPRLNASLNSQWVIELGGLRDTFADAEEIRDDLLRLIYGLWDHVKNHCPEQHEAAATRELAWVGYVAGKRESRRLLGDVILTQNDIINQTHFPDCVAYGGWANDDHFSPGFFHTGGTARNNDDKTYDCTGVPFAIPFRALYSRNVDNLLMAGRNMSATHLAMSNTRVMLTGGVEGQAVGTAAALCAAHGATPRVLYRDHLAELQQALLKDGAYLMGVANNDPRDLARTATAAASSDGGPGWSAWNVINGRARIEGDAANAWQPAPKAAWPQWVELRWDEPVAFNVVHVTFITKEHAPRRFRLQVFADGGWLTAATLDANRHRRHTLAVERRVTTALRVVMDEPGAAPTGISEIRVYDEPEPVVACARRREALLTVPDTLPDLPWKVEAPALPGYVIDDREAGKTGAWTESDFAEPFIGAGYVHDGNIDKGGKTIAYEQKVDKAGTYDIRFSYVAYANRATNTPVMVSTPAGERTIHIDQRRPPPADGRWFPLGEVTLAAGDTVRVTVSNAGTKGYVVADAVHVLPVGGTPPRP